jgi:hypothetical protein
MTEKKMRSVPKIKGQKRAQFVKEIPQISIKTYFSGQLMVVRHVPETRRINGLLVAPPHVFFTYWSEELAEVRHEMIAWAAAVGLSPDHMKSIALAIEQDRLVERAQQFYQFGE